MKLVSKNPEADTILEEFGFDSLTFKKELSEKVFKRFTGVLQPKGDNLVDIEKSLDQNDGIDVIELSKQLIADAADDNEVFCIIYYLADTIERMGMAVSHMISAAVMDKIVGKEDVDFSPDALWDKFVLLVEEAGGEGEATVDDIIKQALTKTFGIPESPENEEETKG